MPPTTMMMNNTPEPTQIPMRAPLLNLETTTTTYVKGSAKPPALLAYLNYQFVADKTVATV